MRSMSPLSTPDSLVARPGNQTRAPPSTSMVTSTSSLTGKPFPSSNCTFTSVVPTPSAGRLSPPALATILSTGDESRSKKDVKGRGPTPCWPAVPNTISIQVHHHLRSCLRALAVRQQYRATTLRRCHRRLSRQATSGLLDGGFHRITPVAAGLSMAPPPGPGLFCSTCGRETPPCLDLV